MLKDKKKELFDRLDAKNLDTQFRVRIERGMGCTPFLSEAITKTVHEVYFPLLHMPTVLMPGQMLFSCISKDASISTPIADADHINVILTIDGSKEDIEVRKNFGVIGLRQHRLVRVCNEALSQGGLLTVEDLSYRIFNVGERTILRDLSALRKADINPPLRSTIKDIGPTISHRATIVKNWLSGDELSDLQRKCNHSFSAIENYLDTFKRVVSLDNEGYSVEQIAYMIKHSKSLVDVYKLLWKTYKEKALPHRRKEVLECFNVIPIKKKKQR